MNSYISFTFHFYLLEYLNLISPLLVFFLNRFQTDRITGEDLAEFRKLWQREEIGFEVKMKEEYGLRTVEIGRFKRALASLQ